ncbi:hypothetical protein HUW62_26075 [Myxococcus sp. AM011]|uniref:hypothetical protein n=1 Tax=Myxococcus sp. AM011 TaxID=2745200 RepID=UPI001595421A|nr:hypothetical protein [Myxococcus sp. AM011]NVJ24701.1 hypothetical protein [Myxococcus sp. AM011]
MKKRHLGIAMLGATITAGAVYALPIKDTSAEAWEGYEASLKNGYCTPLNENWNPYSEDSIYRGAPKSKDGRSKWKVLPCTIDRTSFNQHYADEADENLPSALCGGAIFPMSASQPGPGMNCMDNKACYEEFVKKVKSLKCVYKKGEAKLVLERDVLVAYVSSEALHGAGWVGRDFKKLFASYK